MQTPNPLASVVFKSEALLPGGDCAMPSRAIWDCHSVKVKPRISIYNRRQIRTIVVSVKHYFRG